jgi:hypothetical protein
MADCKKFKKELGENNIQLTGGGGYDDLAFNQMTFKQLKKCKIQIIKQILF